MKSISIQILASINHLEKRKSSISKNEIYDLMTNNKIGIDEIRVNRLDQMVILMLATKEFQWYKITDFGYFVNKFANFILALFNQKRL